jgi:hypothetical protein
MELVVIYNSNGVQGFLDAADSTETHDFLMGNYPGCSKSSNTIQVEADMILPHEVGVIDGVASVLSGAALQASIDAVEAQRALAALRKVRDRFLAETDWWASSDLTMSPERTAYRQALRDITNTYSSLDDVVWPIKPA